MRVESSVDCHPEVIVRDRVDSGFVAQIHKSVLSICSNSFEQEPGTKNSIEKGDTISRASLAVCLNISYCCICILIKFCNSPRLCRLVISCVAVQMYVI